MLNAILALAFGALVAYVSNLPDDRRFKKWAKADDERDLMFRKFLELRDDPTMTEGKWREWLPIFEEVDRNYARNNYFKIELFSLADRVRQEIDPDLDLKGV